MASIKSFTDLLAWKEGHKLVLHTYKIVKKFPKEEQYILTSQILRCSVSITSNLAEGFSRQSKKEKTQFYSISLGSLSELQNQLLIARDVKYINDKKFKFLADQTIKVHKLINGLMKTVQNRPK